MNGVNFILGIVGLIVIVIGLYFAAVKKKTVGRIISLVGAAIIIFSLSFSIVPTGYTGVKTTFGQISADVAPNGFNWKIPVAQKITLVNNKQRDILFEGQVWGETTEKTPVYGEGIIVTYQIPEDKSAWIFTNISNGDSGLIDGDTVSSSVKAAMGNLPADKVTVRDEIEPLVKNYLIDSLTEKYGANTVLIKKVIIRQMDFEDSYNEAIAQKSIAQKELETQKINNEIAVAEAEADKKVAMAKAEAEAEAMRIKAAAEAEANNLIADSLKNEVLQAKFYEKWNGKLPQVMGDNGIILDIGSTVTGEGQ